jgi:hypothetical protein
MAVPLSEHEQRLLDQIERALYQEDPKFASTVRQTDLRTHMKRRLRRAAVVFVVGFALLLAGLTTHTLVGIAGFAVMVLALVMAMTAWKRMGQGPQAVPSPGGESSGRGSGRGSRPVRPSSPRRSGSGGGLVSRLEERWKRRWDERDR